jgi:hypothetical protein
MEASEDSPKLPESQGEAMPWSAWSPTTRRSVAAGAVAVVLLFGGLAWWQASKPTAAERDAQRQEEISDFYTYEVPHDEEAWDKVAEVCDLDSNAVMVDYQHVSRSDYDAYYEYEDEVGQIRAIPVSLNSYGAITWVDSCYTIPGVGFTYADRVDVDWGEP